MNWFTNLFYTPPYPQNRGVVDAPLRPTDFIVGVNSPIIYKVRLQSGDWTPYVFSQVKQWNTINGVYQDNLGCTGNSLATQIEAQIFFLTGQKIQLSRRWINKMSGCNQGALKGIGNYVTAPVDWVRNNGFVLEEDYPTPASWTVDQYYADIPEPLNSALLAKAKANWNKYAISYEFDAITEENVIKQLKQGTLGTTLTGHQVAGDGYTVSTPAGIEYRDSYEPWDKTLGLDSVKFLMKIIVELRNIQIRKIKFSDSPEVWHVIPDDSMESLTALDAKLPDSIQAITGKGYSVDTNIYTINAKKPSFNN